MKKNKTIKLSLAKLTVCFLAVFFITSFFIAPALFGNNTAYADDNTKKIVKVDGKPCSSDEIIVKFKDGSTKEKKSNALDSIDPSYKNLSVKNTVKIKIPKDKSLEEYLAELNLNPDIEYAQPNFLYELDTTVNDPFAFPGADESDQWYHDTINTFEAWDYTMGAGVTVAVLDTGAYITHPDLGTNIALMPDIASNDNDGLPYDYSSVPQDDDHGHGTHVTGIIGATANNSQGGAGIAPASDVVVYDIFEHFEIQVYDEGTATWVGTGDWATAAFTDDIITGIESAVTYGADIINMSLGAYQDPDSTAYWDVAQKDAVDAAVAAGVVVVCSAGNDNYSDGSPDNMYHAPSDYDSAISVISTDYSDSKSDFSNYGPSKDISAPGGAILSTYLDSSYAYLSGTSMASPVVAGVCALILSADPTLTVAEVKDILYSTAVDLGDENRDDYFGWGRVDAYAAVLAALDIVYNVELNRETLEVEPRAHGNPYRNNISCRRGQ